MGKKILVIASNYGLWAEELQGPWDALTKAGHQLTLATKLGKTPKPLEISVNPELIDPMQNYLVNPKPVVDRVLELLRGGAWDRCIKTADAKMADYQALVIVGGPGAPLDITGNPFVHKLVLDAYSGGKTIGTICYAVAALCFTRNPANRNRSILWGKKVTAHPHAWDFDSDLPYALHEPSPDNAGTNLVTQGFVYPLQYMVEDAVGPEGTVVADTAANREKPCVAHDAPFVSALSVESSIAFGQKLVEVLA